MLLCGEGADEIFAGYPWHQSFLKARQTRSYFPKSSWKVIDRFLFPLAHTIVSLDWLCITPLRAIVPDAYLAARCFAYNTQEAVWEVVTPDLRKSWSNGLYGKTFKDTLLPDIPGGFLDRALYLDLKTGLLALLMKQDRMSMAASVESRVPFLDHVPVEQVFSIPENLKLRNATSKYLLKRAMSGLLPDEILHRPKVGFPVPLDVWLRGRMLNVFRRILLDRKTIGRGIYQQAAIERLLNSSGDDENQNYLLWLLFTLELWFRIFIDREPYDAISLQVL